MPSELPEPDFVTAHHFSPLAAAGDAARVGDWAGVAAFFATLARADDRVVATWALAELDGCEPSSGPAGTHPLRAARLINQGRDDRARLCRAEVLLSEITATTPDDVTAWVARIVTARRLHLGLSETQRRYAQAIRRASHAFTAQQQLFRKLLPKWGGSHASAEAFARDSAATAPVGSPVPAMIVDYHLERWAGLAPDERAGYLAQRAVRADVAVAARRTVLDPGFQPGYLRYRLHNTFAAVYSLSGDRTAAAVQFRAIGANATPWPWCRFRGDRRQAFLRHRAEAVAAG